MTWHPVSFLHWELTTGRLVGTGNGVVFAETVKGKPMSNDYAERRSHWEPLMEVRLGADRQIMQSSGEIGIDTVTD